jgi:hypothetical protein
LFPGKGALRKFFGNKYVRLFLGALLTPVLALVVAVPLILVIPKPASDLWHAIYYCLIIGGGYFLLVYIARIVIRAVTGECGTAASIIAVFSVTIFCAVPVSILSGLADEAGCVVFAIPFSILPILIWMHWVYFSREGWLAIFVCLGCIFTTIVIAFVTILVERFIPTYLSPLLAIPYMFAFLSLLTVLMVVESWLANLFLKNIRRAALSVVATNGVVVLFTIVVITVVGSFWPWLNLLSLR